MAFVVRRGPAEMVSTTATKQRFARKQHVAFVIAPLEEAATGDKGHFSDFRGLPTNNYVKCTLPK